MTPIIIGIDHGYAVMKTAHCSFQAGVVAYEHRPFSMENVLELEGKYYRIIENLIKSIAILDSDC